VTSKFVMSVLLSARIKERDSHWTDFGEIFYLRFLLKFVEAISTLRISCAQTHFCHRADNLCTYNICNHAVLAVTCFGAKLPSSGNNSSIEDPVQHDTFLVIRYIISK